jgi:putative acetyltransferase
VALEIAKDSPLEPDVLALLEAHLTFAHTETPAGHVHALDPDALQDPAVTFFSAREDGVLLGVGALKELDDAHGELKSMHTRDVARQRGVGRAMVRHLLAVAADRGYRRVSLETGAMEVFAPARALYESVGFRRCEPFGEYTVNPYSVCMSLEL